MEDNLTKRSPFFIGYAIAAKNLYNLENFISGYNILLRIEGCGRSMLIARAFKYELDSNNQQRTRLSQHAGFERCM